MTHDFKTAVVDLHGVHQTLRVEKPFGGKNIDVLCDLFADSVLTGKRNPRLPFMYGSTVASEYAWKFVPGERMHEVPANMGKKKKYEKRIRITPKAIISF